MQSKLTLTVDKEVIQSAKDYAKENARSLSNIVEEYLKSLVPKKTNSKKRKYSKLVQELKGSVKLPNGKKELEILEDALMEKHLK